MQGRATVSSFSEALAFVMAQVDEAVQADDSSETSSSSGGGGGGGADGSSSSSGGGAAAASTGDKRAHPRAVGGAPTSAAMALMEDQRHVLMPLLAELTSAVAAKNWFVRRLLAFFCFFFFPIFFPLA